MPCEWLIPVVTERLDLTGAAFADRTWRAGEAFHASTAARHEIPYTTAAGDVRIVVYQARGGPRAATIAGVR